MGQKTDATRQGTSALRGQRHVLRTLRSLADEEGRVCITMGRLAEEAGYKPRWTKSLVRRLEQEGHVSVERPRGGHVKPIITLGLQGCSKCTPSKKLARPDQDREPEPWRSLSATGVMYLRHRMARHTNAEIASHYGIKPTKVVWHLGYVLRSFQKHTGLRLPDVTSLALLAVQHGLKPLDLPTHPRADIRPPEQPEGGMA